MAQATETTTIRVGTKAELEEQGVVVVRGRHRRIAVFADGDAVYAVENNCPHMGFPLDRGTVRDGMLTCHWHQARFDLRSGCTFDLWADDVARYACWEENGEVFVSAVPDFVPDEAFHRARLVRGIEQNVGLVQAKSILALLEGGASLPSVLQAVVEFATANLTEVSEGLIRLICIARLYPNLSRDTAYQGLYYAIRKIAEEASTSTPRRPRDPLAQGGHDLDTLKLWLRQWVQTRHRDGAERTVLTAVEKLAPDEIAELVFMGATERLYADGGHQLEGCNKVFELIELLGADQAPALVGLLMPDMTGARGREESTNWHHPIELVEPLRALEKRLPDVLAVDADPQWCGGEALTQVILGDDPLASLLALEQAFNDGAPAHLVARQVSYAAALRLARFATSNEVTDWFNPQHTFIYTNGVFQAVTRSPTPDVVRGIFHGAMSVYMDRYLNVPAARLPSMRASRDELGSDSAELQTALLRELDQRANIERVADIVSRYVDLDLDLAGLIDTLAYATVREDLDFHSLQVLEAGVNQCSVWPSGPERENILVGVARNLGAHCPTRRAGQQTAEIAQRLHRGDIIFEEQANA
ncbi:MAG: Rieske 2Fe-2S domain-containing protein [Pseudomonadales bacterium]